MAVECIRRCKLNSAVCSCFLRLQHAINQKSIWSLSVSIPLGLSTPARTMRARLTHSQLPSLVILALDGTHNDRQKYMLVSLITNRMTKHNGSGQPKWQLGYQNAMYNHCAHMAMIT